MKNFEKIDVNKLNESAFRLIGQDWMLITAGSQDDFNTMTAAWGGFGVLWHKPVVFTFIRPPRYTFEYTEKHDLFSLTFFPDGYEDSLTYLGSVSGRDEDKVKESGLSPVYTDAGTMAFEEARLIIECKKMYFQDMNPADFISDEIESYYPNKDYHRMYVGEVISAFLKK